MSSQEENPSESVNLFKSTQNNPQILGLMENTSDNELKGVTLEFKDYLAITIALLETVFLPLGILMGVLFVLAFILNIMA